MEKNRYNELKKENDVKLETLTDSYKHIARTYVLKARGYAEKTLDTEARIKDVLDELLDACEQQIPVFVKVPDMSGYIESKINLLAKRSNKKEKVKSIVFTVLFIGFILSVIILGLYFRSGNYLDKPDNIKHEVIDGSFTISWDIDKNASAGYIIYYETSGLTTKDESIIVELPLDSERASYTFNDIDLTKEYTFYIQASQVTSNTNESAIIIYYASDVAEYKYTPGE